MDALRNRHQGERCFIIGNGPSLAGHDLTRLIGERTIATNMFPLHPLYDRIGLDYYCASDWIHWSTEEGFAASLRRAFAALPDCRFVFEYNARSVVEATGELIGRDVNYLLLDDQRPVWDGYFNIDLSRPVHWGRSVVTDFCLPLACFLGFSEIYLIGCDFDWNRPVKGRLAHGWFYDYDADDRKVDDCSAHRAESGREHHIALALEALEKVAEMLVNSDHKVYNAGIGGRLDCFSRVDFDSLW